VLQCSAAGVLSDLTATAIPAVSGDEDWRAQDGALADFDGDGDLDLAIVTDATVAVTGRPSLRILANGGTGTFTDKTSSWVPANTEYGERSQGVALVAADVDGEDGVDLVLAHTEYFTETIIVRIHDGDPNDPVNDPPIDVTTINYYAAVRVLVNDGTGKMLRAPARVPAVTPSDVHQYQADAMTSGDIDGDGDPDLVLTSDRVTENPTGTFHRTAKLLRNDGGTYVDASSALPAASDPDYLQGGRLRFADADGDGDSDLFVLSATVLMSPTTSTPSTGPSLRLLVNGGGTFTRAAAGTLPGTDGSDQLQGADFTVGDLSGDGKPEVVILSTLAPNTGGRACRILRATGAGWVRASQAMPNPLTGDDGRGRTVLLLDLGTGDGDLDLVLARDEANETVRNTRVLTNPRK
jgi:hypothetical protein